jgi:hypothetical protein
MRVAGLILVLSTLIGCTSAAPPPADNTTTEPPTMSWRTLQNGGYGALQERVPRIKISTDTASYAHDWEALVGSGTSPAVDFTKESVIFIMAGRRNTGGYAVQAEDATVTGDVATVRVRSVEPPSGGVTTQVITSPFVVIAVSHPGIASARWIDIREGRVVAEDSRTP